MNLHLKQREFVKIYETAKPPNAKRQTPNAERRTPNASRGNRLQTGQKQRISSATLMAIRLSIPPPAGYRAADKPLFDYKDYHVRY
jgi:hypothetical protein